MTIKIHPGTADRRYRRLSTGNHGVCAKAGMAARDTPRPLSYLQPMAFHAPA